MTVRALVTIVETAANALPIDVATLDWPSLGHPGAPVGVVPDAAFSIHDHYTPHHAPPIEVIEPPGAPPPDLVIDTTATSTSPNDLSIYAELGVAEIWRYDDTANRVAILRLRDGEYRAKRESAALVPLTSDLLTMLVRASHTAPACVWQSELTSWLQTYD